MLRSLLGRMRTFAPLALLVGFAFSGLSLLAPISRAEGVLLFDSADAVSITLANEAPAVADSVQPEPTVAQLLPPVVIIPTTATRTYRTPDLDEAGPRIKLQRRPFVWL